MTTMYISDKQDESSQFNCCLKAFLFSVAFYEL